MEPIDLSVYPDACDASGHLNQASFLTLFERARWEAMARGPGMDVFSQAGCWPAVRKTSIDYLAQAFPGDVLRFHTTLTHRGRTSFVLRQTATRLSDDVRVALAEFVFVCIDRRGVPVPVPEAIGRMLAGAGGSGGERITVNGVTLAVDVVGEGPAVLFIHGFPLDRTMWRSQLSGLAQWRRIAPDLRGLGHSDAPDLGYSMATYADDLAALLDVLGEDRVALVGLSMGGYVTFEFARRWPDRVAGMVLMDTRAEADTAEGKRGRDGLAAAAREQGAGAVADAMLPKLLAPATRDRLPELVLRTRRTIEATPVSGLVGALTAIRDRPDSTALLPRLGGWPVLVLAGSEDPVTPPQDMRVMADAIPGAEFLVVEGAGHLPPLERPDEVTGLLREFLGRL